MDSRRVLLSLCTALLVGHVAIGNAHAAEWDHVHLTVPDTPKAVAWYVHYFGGTPTKSGPFDAIWFGPNLLKFRAGTDTQGSAGSPVNHIGFSVDDVAKTLAQMESDGVKIVRPTREIGDVVVAHVEDPWGTQIELIHDRSPPGFHHVHLLSPDPKAALQWYADVYGGTVTHYHDMQQVWAIHYANMWLMATEADGVSEFKGRSIDHIGWNMKDFDATMAKLKAKKAVFQLGPRKSGDHMMAFVEGPHAVKIENIEDVVH